MPSDFQRKFRQTQLPSSVYYRNDDAKGLPKSFWQSGDKKENRRFFMYLHCSKTSNIFVKIKWIRPHFNKHTSFWYWEHWNTWNVINMLSNYCFFQNTVLVQPPHKSPTCLRQYLHNFSAKIYFDSLLRLVTTAWHQFCLLRVEPLENPRVVDTWKPLNNSTS